MTITPTAPSLDLSRYGGGCRCLLRLRENRGSAGIPDRHFIGLHLHRYPEWKNRPGHADVATVIDLARELGLADRFELSRNYLHVRDEHRSGADVLAFTERPPQQSPSELPYDRYVTLVQNMDEASFTLWCPYRSGHSDVLPAAAAEWWDRWHCVGLILRTSAEAERG